ncbi:MAG: DUF2344 domain-containing protein [Clostridia bacterium]|nr:DUF2344 domain-containing protein [Clostridia bacterium]
MVPQAQVNQNGPAVFFPMRFRLRKDGLLQYISHLDFVRTMTKALVRSKLPLWFTQGFNPIPKITFAAPLSVGMESDCELMDVRLCEPTSPDVALKALRAVMPDAHLEVLDAYIPENKLSSIGYLAYDLCIAYDGISSAHAEEAERYLSSPSIVIEKTGKSGKPREVDLKPMIASATLKWDEEKEEIVGRWVLSASPDAFLNPDLLLGALRTHTPLMQCEGDVWYSLRRVEIYAPDLTVFR